MFLRIDSSLRNWVFIPLTLITVCVSLLMKYLTYIFNQGSEKKIKSETKTIEAFDYKTEMKNKDTDIVIKNAINRANLLKNNFMYISEKGFKQRKAFFCKEETGFFSQKYESKSPDLMNPNMMGDMMKKNLVNALYYIVIFVGGGYFFSGFILLKFPFGLTQKFRSMMQQGLNLPDVDVSYVSAISWCLILVFGINSILQFFDGGDDFDMFSQQQQMMTQPMNMMNNPMGGKDYEKILKPEKESINILPNFSLIDDSVDRLIQKYDGIL